MILTKNALPTRSIIQSVAHVQYINFNITSLYVHLYKLRHHYFFMCIPECSDSVFSSLNKCLVASGTNVVPMNVLMTFWQIS